MSQRLVALTLVAKAAALQLETAPAAPVTKEQLSNAHQPCLDNILNKQAELGDVGGCPVKFFMFDMEDPMVADCYGHYISDQEFKRWTEWSQESHHVGPIFAARYLPKHRCMVKDPAQADLFLVPPFLPQWNRNFDNKDQHCQKMVLKLAARSEAYANSWDTGHSNFVILNWWKGREYKTLQTSMFPNATYVGKDCKSDKCQDPFVGWPYFDNSPGSFDSDDTVMGTRRRNTTVVGVWGSRRGGDSQREPLQHALLHDSFDSEFMSPGAFSDHGVGVFNLYKRSKFCLNPRGDSLSRRSLSTCVLAGSIPVIMVDGLNLPFEHVLNYSTFSVRFPQLYRADDMLSDLRKLTQAQVATLQRNTVCARRAFLYDGRTTQNAVAPGGLLDFLLADIAHVAMRRPGWQRPS